MAESEHYIDQIFGADGLLAQQLPGYEMRPEQVQLAHTIDQGFCEGRHVLAEAPCGTGKSLAYGVPAIAHACYNKKRCVICTANIQLQEQLYYKDLPFLQGVLPFKFSFALMKGKSNYFCQDRRIQGQADGSFDKLRARPSTRKELTDVIAWADYTRTGDKTELNPAPSPAAWNAVSVSSDDCKGEDCGFFETCFYQQAKRKAMQCHIVVTNYHMLFGHLAVRKLTGQDLVLPPFEHLVMDEGHEAAEIARKFMGFTLSRFVIEKLTRWLRGLGPKYRDLMHRLATAAESFFAVVRAVREDRLYNIRLRAPSWEHGAHAALLPLLDECVELAIKSMKNQDITPQMRSDAAQAYNTASSSKARLLNCVNLHDPNFVYWIELTAAKNAIINARPIDVSSMLRDELFLRTRASIMTSATLSTGGTFDFIRGETGVPTGALESIVTSPFNFTEQALFVVPMDSPQPKEDVAFARACAEAVTTVAKACGGRTLCLFTSNKNMKATHDLVRRKKLPYRLLLQGSDLQRMELYRIFREDETSVLFGVASFWTGVDIPGEALIGLVIDKLPFPNMSDPFVDAVKVKWKDSFKRYMVPKAIITLKQGVGRLIRRRDDYGVVVVVDRRIVEHSAYNRQFLLSLPPMASSRQLEDIPGFLEPRRQRAEELRRQQEVRAKVEEARHRAESEIAEESEDEAKILDESLAPA